MVKPSSKEPVFLITEEQVIKQSPLAAEFLARRSRQNDVVMQADNGLIKRFYNIDHNAYLEGGAIPALYKELMGLSGSLILRCDDCVMYHVIQAYRLGAERVAVEESMNIALVIGGSIVVPHLRRAYLLLAELYSP